MAASTIPYAESATVWDRIFQPARTLGVVNSWKVVFGNGGLTRALLAAIRLTQKNTPVGWREQCGWLGGMWTTRCPCWTVAPYTSTRLDVSDPWRPLVLDGIRRDTKRRSHNVVDVELMTVLLDPLWFQFALGINLRSRREAVRHSAAPSDTMRGELL